MGDDADRRAGVDERQHGPSPLIVGRVFAVFEVAPSHAPAIFRAARLLEQVLEIGARRSRHL
ncbi:hypothetical protein, partial [Mesorhizobium sp.]|uniref:hypothetical protein n=1 Tax=Mesorhizobium sp. TaxID=1871066 RepID=UPI0025E42DF6